MYRQTLALAWRNLGRNLRRTILTAGALGVGVTLMVFMLAFLDGMFERVVRVSTSSLSGHAQIHASNWRVMRDERLVLSDPETLKAAALALPEVEAASARVWGTGLVAIGDRSKGVSLLGVEPENEPNITNWSERVVVGTAEFTDDRQIVMGAGLTEELDVELGAKLVLMVADVETGEANSESVRLIGIIHTGMPSIDDSTAIVPIATARRVLGVGDAAHEIAIRLSIDPTWPGPIERALVPLQAPGIEVVPWHAINRAAAGGLELQANLRWIFVLVVFIVIAFGIVNTVAMSLLERWREFGLLRALGTSPGNLGALVLAEAGWIGLMGAIPGALAGLALNRWLGHVGISLGNSSAYGVSFIDPLYPAWNPMQAVELAATFAGLTMLVALVSAWRAARVDPIEAMRRATAA